LFDDPGATAVFAKLTLHGLAVNLVGCSFAECVFNADDVVERVEINTDEVRKPARFAVTCAFIVVVVARRFVLMFASRAFNGVCHGVVLGWLATRVSTSTKQVWPGIFRHMASSSLRSSMVITC
jgi:hypothetical protein